MIISHDVDHLSAREHARDLIIPKFLIRSCMELLSGGISPHECRLRLSSVLHAKEWQNIHELMRFDRSQGVPSTFFLGVSKDLGMAYGAEAARPWIETIRANGFAVGLHGVCFDDWAGIKGEQELFRSISGLEDFGTRMHYLRLDDSTLELLSAAGYMYDSTEYALENPYRVSRMYEFPVQIMDVRLIYSRSRVRPLSLGEAQKETARLVDEAMRRNLEYFTVLSHDRYFCRNYRAWRDWYLWTIEFLQARQFEFVSFDQAVREMEIQPGASEPAFDTARREAT